MQRYEITFLTRSEESDGGVADLLAQAGAQITSRSTPSRRKLAYPIKKETAAVYYTYQFEAPTQTVKDLSARLNRNEQVLRYLVISGGIRKPNPEEIKTLKEKDLEVPESVMKGTEEFAAEAAKEEAAKAEEKQAEVAETETTEEVVEESPVVEEATTEETPVEAETEVEEVKEEVVEEPIKKTSRKKKEVSAEELTAEERQKKLDEKLKDILGE